MSGSARQASSLTQRFNMIEDRSLIMLPPVAESLADCFTAVQNTPAGTPITELVTVSGDGNLLHISPEASSGSGWAHDEVSVDGAPGAAIDKVVAFYQAGTLLALAHYPALGGGHQVLGMQLTAATGWGPVLMSGNMLNAFGQMRQTDRFVAADGTVYVYGISEKFSPATFVMAAVNATGGEWDLVFFEPVASATASYRLLPGYAGDDICVVTLDGPTATFRGGSVKDGVFAWGTNPTTSHDLGLGTLTSERVYPVPSASGDQAFLLLAADQQAYHVGGYATGTPQAVALTGGPGQPAGAQWVEVGLDSLSRFMVFVIATSGNQLWLLRQTAASASAGPVAFDPWVQLGNALGAIACPGVMTAGPELFFYDLSGNVQHMNQELVSGVWFTSRVLSPSAAPDTDPATDATTYTQELTAVDATGAPVPKTVLNIYSDQKTVLIVNGLAHHAGPSTPAVVVADAAGRITVASVSNGLSSPKLTVTAAAFGAGVVKGPYRSDLRVHQRLANQDPSFPVTGTSLVQAGLVPSTIPQSDADDFASKLNTLGGAAVEMHSQSGGETLAARPAQTGSHCFRMDFTQPGRIVTQEMTAEEFTAHASLAETSLEGFFGHIANFFKNLIHDLEAIVVKIENGIVNLAITVAGAIKNFTLKTIAEIGNAFELLLMRAAAFFDKVIDAIKTAVEWLRMLFQWDDIINTKKVIEYYVTTGLKNVARDLSGEVPKYLTGLFNGIKSDIGAAFDNLESIFEKSVGMNQMMPASSSNPALRNGPPLTAASLTQARSDNSVQCNYARNKASQQFSTAGSPLAYAATGAADIDVSGLLSAFSTAFPTDQLEASWAKIKALTSQIHDAKSFFDVAVLDLLEAAKDLLLIVVGGIEAVLIVLSEIAGGAVAALNALLTHTIHIPIISNIYQEIAGGPLNLLDLMCLILAVPATVLYKILFGGGGSSPKPPFSSEDVARITGAALPWPTIPGATVAARAEGSDGDGYSGILALCFLFVSAFYAVEDPLLDMMAAAELENPASGEDGVSYYFGILAIVTSVMVALFGAPWSTFAKPASERTGADNWSIGLWCVNWLPILLDTVFAFANATKHRITRFLPVAGPWIMTVAGIIMIGIGAKTVAEMEKDPNYNAASKTAALIGAFPYVFKPIVLTGLQNPVGLALNIVLWVVDFACDVGEAVASMFADIPESQEA